MNKKIQDAINDQIQAEFQSAYIYLAMSAHFAERNLNGFAHWLQLQWQEEIEHAMKFYHFILRRGGSVELKTIDKPEIELTNPLQIFEAVLQHEQYITSRINDLYALAVEEKDYAFQTLLHWFIDEQVEEEENATDIIEKLKLIGDSGQALFLLDRELGERAPEAESNE